MSVLVNKNSKIIVQGFTGSEGTFHASQMIEYGTNVVGGVTPGKGGSTHLDRPVFNTVKDAVDQAGADTSIIFVPPAFAADAIMEAADAGIKVIITITEGIPVADMIKANQYIKGKDCRLIGPNCPGVITPGEAKVGIMPGFVFKKGTVGIVSKSGTLTYEAADQVVKQGLGITTAIGIGGDPIIGTTTKQAVELLMNDPETKCIVMIGEIGGQLEADAAKWIKADGNRKPVVGFIAGETAPKGRTMGHAGAIVGGADDTAEAKKRIMRECGIFVVDSPAEKAGFLKHDKIISVNEEPVTYWQEFTNLVLNSKEDKISVTLERDGIVQNLLISPREDNTIGVSNSQLRGLTIQHKDYSFFESISIGNSLAIWTLKDYITQFKYVFTKKGATSIGGFIAIGNIFPSTWSWQAFWSITAFLSIMLGFMNLLPIPALDGGHVVFTLFEMITGKKPNDKFLEYAQVTGFILLIALLLLANGNDVVKLLSKFF